MEDIWTEVYDGGNRAFGDGFGGVGGGDCLGILGCDTECRSNYN